MNYLIDTFTTVSVFNTAIVIVYVFKFVPHDDTNFKAFLEDIYHLTPPRQLKLYKSWLIMSCVMMVWLCYLMLKDIFWG